MKVLLEGWRQYLSEVYAVDIEKGSIVEVDEGGSAPPQLYLLLGNIFIPLTHVDIDSPSGLEHTYISDGGGRLRIPYSKIDEKLQRGEMRVILDPGKAKKLTRQFQELRNTVYMDYEQAGATRPVYGEDFKRRHPVDIDLEALKVTLK